MVRLPETGDSGASALGHIGFSDDVARCIVEQS